MSSFKERTVNANGTYSENTHITGSDIMQPVEIQGRFSQTIQTHNAVSIAASGWSTQTTWVDCSGYDKLAITLLNDAATTSSANILWSHDGVTTQGADSLAVASSTNREKSGIVDVKARYAKLTINNGDSAAAHTMSAWAYLKA